MVLGHLLSGIETTLHIDIHFEVSHSRTPADMIIIHDSLAIIVQFGLPCHLTLSWGMNEFIRSLDILQPHPTFSAQYGLLSCHHVNVFFYLTNWLIFNAYLGIPRY